MSANVSLCPFNFTVLPHIKLFSPISTDNVCQELMSIKLVHYCTLLFMTHHYDVCHHNTTSHVIIKQAVKLNGLTITVNYPFKEIHCAMVNPFILHRFPFSLTDAWKGEKSLKKCWCIVWLILIMSCQWPNVCVPNYIIR